MILKIEPFVDAIESVQQKAAQDTKVILLTPRGQLFQQSVARDLADLPQDLILVGGRYEGYDERLVTWADYQISIGHYILTGAELPALVVVDSIVRLIDGVLGNPESIHNESFSVSAQNIEYPQYTKPEIFRDLKVPQILLSGNHQQIADWRQKQAEYFKL